MALSKLSGDEECIIFSQLCNVLEPGVAVGYGSASSEVRTLTQVLLQQLRADYEAAAALCLKLGMRSCKELREAKKVHWTARDLSAADLALLGTLGSVLPALEQLRLFESPAGAAGPDGVQRLAEGLGAGALPALSSLNLNGMHVGDAGASALAAALGRGAMPRLRTLYLNCTAIGDAGLVALAPALRRLPALMSLGLSRNPLSDEGLTAFVAPPPPPPPPPAGALSPPAVLANLYSLDLSVNQISNAGCAALASALDSGALPALRQLVMLGTTRASAAAKAAVREACARRVAVGQAPGLVYVSDI